MGSSNPSRLYFAFGSNLLTARLTRRCPSARVVARAAAHGHRVAFAKLSEDTSGKATLVTCAGPGAAVGVVYELAAGDADALDAFEGPGYRRLDRFRATCLDTGRDLTAFTYVAINETAGLRPYDWYLALILAGLAEHGIGREYARTFRETAFDTDTRHGRQSRQNALRDLAAAGWPDYEALLRPDA